ncbi:hypothetical protein V5O48_011117 [Marasmius crinis-equi]|uniref:WD40 repeat-like protein n=1 Tax=Marasmius crinis-equi TaxID=585013 RepID=A0ABR3F6H2_9AGAR
MDGDSEQGRRSESPEAATTTLERLAAVLAAHAQARGHGIEDTRTLAASAMAQLLMGNSGSGGGLGGYRVRVQDDEEDEEQNDDAEWYDEDDAVEEDDWYSAPATRTWIKPHSSPQEAGVNLLKGGEFGRVEPKTKARGNPRNVNIARVISSRLSKPHPALYKEDITSTRRTWLKVFKDFRLHLFDTTAPPEPLQPSPSRRGYLTDASLQTTMKVNRTLQGQHGRWTITDANLSPDNQSVRIEAHEDDINSCCWADTASGNVLVSASDDTYLKVWDRRSLGASQKPSGVLVGHTEGLTYVSAKGDGRYVLSNGKDQAVRLWDLRKMRGSEDYTDRHFGISGFDYRYQNTRKPRHTSHPQDCSVMTYRGHSVMMTLIRCHFSPAETTGAQYLYSGSADGRIHIWSLDGTVVQVLDRRKTLPMAVDYTGPEYPPMGMDSSVCVRDVSWHSQQPVVMSAAWESRRTGSTLARHDWKGLSKLAGSLEDWNEKRRQEEREGGNPSRTRSGRVTTRMPGSLVDLDDDMDDDEDDDEYIP